MADSAIRFLKRTETCSASAKRKIREYYRTAAVKGKYQTRHDGYSGMIVWKVDR